MRRVGVLMTYPESDTAGQARVAAFGEALQELGWHDGRNVRIDSRWSGGDAERLRTGAVELVAMSPDVIASGSTMASLAAKNATTTVPVVAIGDLIELGVVASLAQPAGNITGLTLRTGSEIAEKWLEKLHHAIPSASRVAFILSVTSPSNNALSRMTAVASRVGVTILPYVTRSAADLTVAFDAIAKDGVDALIVNADPFVVSHRHEIVDFAATHRLPAVY